MKSLKILILILNIIICNNIYSQKYVYTNVKRNLIEYQISDSLKNLLINYIINDFGKYNDNSIYFIVNVNNEYYKNIDSIDSCAIYIEITTDILPSNEKEINGFFKVNNKLFFIKGHNCLLYLYPTDSIKEVEYKKVIINENNPLEELLYISYIGDIMPFWLFGFKDGEFRLIDYWGNYNFDNW